MEAKEKIEKIKREETWWARWKGSCAKRARKIEGGWVEPRIYFAGRFLLHFLSKTTHH